MQMDKKKQYPPSKAQVTVELMIITSLVFIIFIGIALVINEKNTQVMEYKRFLSAKDIADKAAFTINDVAIAGFGASNYYYIPSSLADGTPFTLTIIPKQRVLVISWQDQRYAAALVTANIGGTLTLSEGRMQVTNRVGKLIIEQ
ncbi:MAG: hypothetical protein QW594_00610 [Candidatus Woesearchaeota archaeon]